LNKLMIVFLSMVMVLMVAFSAQAADFGAQVYGEYGFNQVEWAFGGTASYDRFVVGGDIIGIDPEDNWDVYAGYKIVDVKNFEVAGLVGYTDAYSGLDWDNFTIGLLANVDITKKLGASMKVLSGIGSKNDFISGDVKLSYNLWKKTGLYAGYRWNDFVDHDGWFTLGATIGF
jgi:hypothetical protein